VDDAPVCGVGTAAESNERFRYLLAQGVNGLSVAFDLPTQMGYDSDHPMAQGEVGKVGVAIDSIQDMAALFDGIPLDRVSTSMTINATAAILLALYIAVARRQQVPAAKLAGTIQNDILKEYVARGTYIYPPRASLRIVTDIFAFCEREVPHWNTISISGYHIREAGSTAVQEVAFTLAHASAYVQAAIDVGLDVNQFGQRLSFFFNAHNNFLEEIAKFRAARRLWARTMRDRFGATNPRAQQLRFHTQTAGSTLTAQQPNNNIVRVALQALAAVLGGTQSLHCNGRDEALALPTEDAARTALRTQQIIAAETGVANTVDPVGGTRSRNSPTISSGRRELIGQIERAGGTLAAIETGFIQRQIQESAYRAARDRQRRGRRRRRERVYERGRRGRTAWRFFVSIRSRALPDRPCACTQGRQRLRGVRPVAGRRRRGCQRREPDAADYRGRGSEGDGRRNLGRDAFSVRRARFGRMKLLMSDCRFQIVSDSQIID
jgi:methylmalonyl-CoA mutase N-terminal domain/subunit